MANTALRTAPRALEDTPRPAELITPADVTAEVGVSTTCRPVTGEDGQAGCVYLAPGADTSLDGGFLALEVRDCGGLAGGGGTDVPGLGYGARINQLLDMVSVDVDAGTSGLTLFGYISADQALRLIRRALARMEGGDRPGGG